MGKNQQQSDKVTKSKSDNQRGKKKPGRPSNIQIQTQFMNIIRDIKLQAINAQTQLELQMAFFTSQDDKKSRRKQQSSINDRQQRILTFTLLTSEEKNSLLQFFEQQKAKWEVKQIEEASELPDYFFDDQNDLALILYRFIHRKKKQAQTKMKAQQIFFISLLCLNSQQALRDAVLEYILKNQQLIQNLIKACIQKVKLKYYERIEKNKDKEKTLGENEEFRVIKQQQDPFEESLYDQSQTLKPKSKQKKIEKSTKKSTKSKKQQSQSQDEPILSQKQKQQKLITCFINYISWSYYYVYPEEERLIESQ